MVIEAVLDFLLEFGGRILVGVGVVLLLVSGLFLGLSSFDQLVFSASLLLGTVSLMLGILAHFELLECPLRSRRNLGTYFIFVAPVLLAAALISLVYGAEINGMWMGRGSEQMSGTIINVGFFPAVAPRLIVSLSRPNGWLFVSLAGTGAGLFVAGLLLKVHEYFS